MKWKLDRDTDWRHGETRIIAVNARRKEYHFFDGAEKVIWLGLISGRAGSSIARDVANEPGMTPREAESRCARQFEALQRLGLITADITAEINEDAQ